MNEDLAVLESDGEDLLVDILMESEVEDRGSVREGTRAIERSRGTKARGLIESTDLLTRRVDSVLSLGTVNESGLLGVEAVKTLGVLVDKVTVEGKERKQKEEEGKEGRIKGQLEGRAMGRTKATVVNEEKAWER